MSSMRLFVMRWVSRKGLHDTKKFLIRLDCTVMKSSSDVFFDAGLMNRLWSSKRSIKSLTTNWMWEFALSDDCWVRVWDIGINRDLVVVCFVERMASFPKP